MLNPSQCHANCIQHTPGKKPNKRYSQQHITSSRETSPIEAKLLGSLHYLLPFFHHISTEHIRSTTVCAVCIHKNNTKDNNIPRLTAIQVGGGSGQRRYRWDGWSFNCCMTSITWWNDNKQCDCVEVKEGQTNSGHIITYVAGVGCGLGIARIVYMLSSMADIISSSTR